MRHPRPAKRLSGLVPGRRPSRSLARVAPGVALALGIALFATAEDASAQYRLRADVYAFGTAPSPAGLMVLSGLAKPTDWADAEAVVWLGIGNQDTERPTGDVLVANVKLRAPKGLGELRLGRMLVTAGAIRPVQLDGANAFGKIPKGPTLQVFGGVPVMPGFASKAYDWAAGGRISQRVAEYASAGVSYLQRRGQGRIDFEELGFDATATPVRWLDAAGEVAVDLLHQDVSSARGSIAARLGPLRLEGFALHRNPAHLLPATSLFAAIGDVPSTQGGVTLNLRAAPRLDINAIGSGDYIGGELGGRASAHAVLRLDDRGDGAVGLEVRRQWAPYESSWTGARLAVRVPVIYRLRASAEIEVVVPDTPKDRGAAWPWGLVALAYSPPFASWLDLAAGLEASASPTQLASFAGLGRLSVTWEKQR